MSCLGKKWETWMSRYLTQRGLSMATLNSFEPDVNQVGQIFRINLETGTVDGHVTLKKMLDIFF
jgi:hypothetical protein